MKPTKVSLLVAAALGSVVATGAATVNMAQADVNQLSFDNTLTLSASSIFVQAEKVTMKLDKDKNTWVNDSVKKDIHECSVDVKIEGRDIATKNMAIGEHYFGEMDLDCKGGDAFKMQFSRVLFLGIRNCVQTETTIDQDYCSLVAVAIHKESDLSAANHDLVQQTDKKKVYMRVNSADAQKNFGALGLMPDGLNADMIDGVQIFNLSIGKQGDQFLIPKANALANFSGGVNHYLTVNAADANRDHTLGSKVDSSVSDLESIVSAIKASSSPKDALDQQMGTFLGKYATTLKDLLAIISPVEYFEREKRLKHVEADLVDLSKTYHPDTVTDRDSFIVQFGSKYSDYQRVATYFDQPRVIVDYSRITQAGANTDGFVREIPRPQPVNPGQAQQPEQPAPAPQAPTVQAFPAELAGYNIGALPSGTTITLKKDLIITPQTGTFNLGSNCEFIVTNSDKERIVKAGTKYVLVPNRRDASNPGISGSQVLQGMSCYTNLQDFVTEYSDIIRLDFPAPDVTS